MPKVVDIERKKAEIAHKALYVFAFEGFHRTTMAQIAQMCHIGRTTIYEYFRNKDEIFTYTLKQSFDAVKLEFRDVLADPALTSLQRISLIITRALSKLCQDRRILLLLAEHTLRIMREDQVMAGQLREQALEVQGMFASLLEEGMRCGEVRRVDAGGMATTLGALLEAAIFLFASDANMPPEPVLDNIETLLRGLAVVDGEG
jgi:AcrR family transcriptional regulator